MRVNDDFRKQKEPLFGGSKKVQDNKSPNQSATERNKQTLFSQIGGGRTKLNFEQLKKFKIPQAIYTPLGRAYAEAVKRQNRQQQQQSFNQGQSSSSSRRG